MSRRVAEIGESGAFSMRIEASKPAYLRRKSLQGRSSKP
jgi:hypothetical protein